MGVLTYSLAAAIICPFKTASPTLTMTSAINSLPEKYKVVLNLYLIEGYDHQEIAQVLNITEVTSRSQLMRGKNKLKGQLKQYNYA